MMKNILLLFFCFLLSQSFAQVEETIKADINEVKIHLQGAEVIRSAKINLSPGITRIAFPGLSPKLLPQSIQLSGGDNVEILSVTSKINFLKEGEQSLRVLKLRDSLELVNDLSQDLADQEQAYNSEKSFIETNKNLKGQDGVKMDELIKGADFMRKRYAEINTALSAIIREKKELNQTRNQIQQQLNELNAARKPTSEIYAMVSSKNIQQSNLKLRYVVNDAGWSPIYDLKTGKINEPIVLKYRALAFNNSGVDWENVKITLSTSDVNQTASQPVLKPWLLNNNSTSFANNFKAQQGRFNSPQILQSNNMSMDVNKFGNAAEKKQEQVSGIRFETIEISALSTDFEIEEKYSIPSDRKPYSIQVNEEKLNAGFLHFSIPKMDKDAFLLAQVIGWEKLDLISGPMNIYHDENYIGLANLDTRTLNDTLSLSLGRDNKVLVTRVKLEELSKNQVLGPNKKMSVAYKITVKNNHTESIIIDLEDQVPVSEIKEIEVKLGDLDGANLISSTGKLKWRMTLQPGESQSVTFDFSIKYPKDQKIELVQKKQIVAPRYY